MHALSIHRTVLAAALVCAAATNALADGTPDAEIAQPMRIEHGGYVTGGLKIWSAGGFSLNLAGVELGGNISNHLALTLDIASNIEGESLALFALRAGARAYLLPGAVSPYASYKVGGLFGGDDGVGIWSAGGGIEVALAPSGAVLDLGVSTVGAFGEEGRLSEISLGFGTRF